MNASNRFALALLILVPFRGYSVEPELAFHRTYEQLNRLWDDCDVSYVKNAGDWPISIEDYLNGDEPGWSHTSSHLYPKGVLAEDRTAFFSESFEALQAIDPRVKSVTGDSTFILDDSWSTRFVIIDHTSAKYSVQGILGSERIEVGFKTPTETLVGIRRANTKKPKRGLSNLWVGDSDEFPARSLLSDPRSQWFPSLNPGQGFYVFDGVVASESTSETLVFRTRVEESGAQHEQVWRGEIDQSLGRLNRLAMVSNKPDGGDVLTIDYGYKEHDTGPYPCQIEVLLRRTSGREIVHTFTDIKWSTPDMASIESYRPSRSDYSTVKEVGRESK